MWCSCLMMDHCRSGMMANKDRMFVCFCTIRPDIEFPHLPHPEMDCTWICHLDPGWSPYRMQYSLPCKMRIESIRLDILRELLEGRKKRKHTKSHLDNHQWRSKRSLPNIEHMLSHWKRWSSQCYKHMLHQYHIVHSHNYTSPARYWPKEPSRGRILIYPDHKFRNPKDKADSLDRRIPWRTPHRRNLWNP